MIRIKEIDAGRGELRPLSLLAMDPKGGVPDMAGERTTEPAFGLPALWIEPAQREEALMRGCTVVDPPSVLATHLTELVREIMAELLSYAETQKLIDDLPREQQKLVSDLIPGVISVGGVQRVLQSLLAERISIRDLPDDPRRQSTRPAPAMRAACRPSSPPCAAGSRGRSVNNIWDQAGAIPIITLSAEWEAAFADSLVGPPEERQLAMAPSKLSEFMRRFRDLFDTFGAESPVLLTSPGIRVPVRTVVERLRPATAVLSQTEISTRARVRTLGSL